MPSFSQDIHIEQDIEERMQEAWDFKPPSLPGQEFAVMCIVAPDGTNQTCPDLAIKLFGCFPTKDAADKYATKLSAECNFFDYFVCSTGDWLKLPPQVASIDDVHYQETALSNIQHRLVEMREARAKIMQERIVADRKARKGGQIEEKKSDD
jgi:hypothetical protein